VVNRYLKRNLLTRHKHNKEIYVIVGFVVIHYGRKLSHVCGYIILENNYDVNILLKGNISCLWVLLNDFVSMIVGQLQF
jgi:hypothetical protein